MLLAANLAVAQEVNTEVKVKLTAAPAEPESITLAAGEQLVLRSKQQIWSYNAKAGDPLEFEAIKPVKVGDLIVIAEGAIATGKITLVQRPKSKGRGGIIGLTVDEVQSVTGEKLKARAYDERNGGNHRKSDIAELMMAGPLPGVGAMLIPVALLLRGNNVMIQKGTRFTAVTDGELSMNWKAIVAAQPIEVKSKDVGEVYLYRGLGAGGYGYFPVTCGVHLVGTLEPGRFIHLKLPPGTYWLQAGEYQVRMDKTKLERLFRLDIEAGNSYYLEFVTESVAGSKNKVFSHFKFVDEVTGANAMTEMLAPGYMAVPPDIALGTPIFQSFGFRKKCYQTHYLQLLQAQVGDKTKAVTKGFMEQVECERLKPALK